MFTKFFVKLQFHDFFIRKKCHIDKLFTPKVTMESAKTWQFFTKKKIRETVIS